MESAEFVDVTEQRKEEAVRGYYDALRSLIESELFDVVAHLDVVERNSRLRGLSTEAQYEDILAALQDSRMIPEINAEQVFSDFDSVHPRPEFLDVLLAGGIRFIAGSDSHAPSELVERVDVLLELFRERNSTQLELPPAEESRTNSTR